MPRLEQAKATAMASPNRPNPDLSLVLKEGVLYAPKSPPRDSFHSQKDAKEHCNSLRSKKFARLSGWALASVEDALKFKGHGELNKRTLWTRDEITAGRVKLVQLIGGRTVEHDASDPRLLAGALCVAKK